MTKPQNKFALALWSVAILYFVAIGGPFLLYGNNSPIQIFDNLIRILASAAQPAALAVLIELVDQIRWNTRTPELQREAGKIGMASAGFSAGEETHQ